MFSCENLGCKYSSTRKANLERHVQKCKKGKDLESVVLDLLARVEKLEMENKRLRAKVFGVGKRGLNPEGFSFKTLLETPLTLKQYKRINSKNYNVDSESRYYQKGKDREVKLSAALKELDQTFPRWVEHFMI